MIAGSSEHGRSYRTLKDKAYHEIKDEILDRRLPAGAALQESDLARRLGVSRTPLREALRHLEKEGLVTVAPGRGAFVSIPSWKEIQEICVIRESVEALAVRLAAHLVPEEEIRKLARLLDRTEKHLRAGDYEAVMDDDVLFHESLNRHCGNTKLIGIIEIFTNQARLHELRILTFRLPGHLEQSLREHRAILEAMRRRDEDAAERLMRGHGHRFFTEGLRHWGSGPRDTSEAGAREPSIGGK